MAGGSPSLRIRISFFRKNILGDVTDIYNNAGTRVAGYAYDAWGNCTVLYNSSGLADVNPFRYRGYYYDSETGFYYLNSRYYDPEIRRFINADDLELIPLLSQTVGQLNLYAYCNDNPIMYSDEDGYALDFILDLFFLGWDIYNLFNNEGYKDWGNWAALGIDLIFAVIPFLTGGGGQTVKLTNVADDVTDFSKVTVIGETMTRVKTVSQFVNATDNLYDGYKAYNRLKNIGKYGIILAEIGGKTSNIYWLYKKLRKGFTIIDIGIDISRTVRSSSYIFERIFIGIWNTRDIWKASYHIF